MRLYTGPGCQGKHIDQKLTDNRGIVDFAGLTPEVYSVGEHSYEGWQSVSPACQTVDLTQSNSGGQSPTVFNQYPPAGVDVFDSGAQVEVDLGIMGIDRVLVNGPTTVQRGTPYDPGDGRMTIDTEILSMDLTGSRSSCTPKAASPWARSAGWPICRFLTGSMCLSL